MKAAKATLLLLLGLVACGDDGPRPVAPAVLPSCASPTEIAGVLGTMTLPVDTTAGGAGALALGECWGGLQLAARPPQSVLAYTVPGSGKVTLAFSADAEAGLEPVVSVRSGDCEAPGEARCFDLGRGASGVVTADAGERLYLVVTSHAVSLAGESRAAGTVQLHVTATDSAPPVLDAVYLELFQGVVTSRLTGRDPDADTVAALVTWVDASGDEIPLPPQMPTGGPEALLAFDADVRGSATFDATLTVSGEGALAAADARRARIRLLDERGNESGVVETQVVLPEEVGYMARCDDEHRCARQLECRSGACRAPDAVVTACAASMPLELATPTDTTTTVPATGELLPGTGAIQGSCSSTPGIERIYGVTVPAGHFDLIARTDVEGPGMGAEQDTVLYIRRVCEDPLSEPRMACNDDSPGAGVRSRVTLLDAPAGAYTVFVEDFDAVDAGHRYPYTLEVALRPVLASGATCDPMEVQNRCESAACTGEGMCP